MSGPELALGIVGAVAAVDVAIKACRRVVEICSALKNAEKEISERSIRLLSNCMQLEMQLEILHKIRDHLDERSQFIQNHVLEILTIKLNAADAQLKGFISSRSSDSHSDIMLTGLTISKWKRSKYAMLKDTLDKSINDVESWQHVSLNPLWLIVMKAQSQEFDKDLNRAKEKNPGRRDMITEAMAVRNPLRKASASHVFLPLEKLSSAVATDIAFSTVKLLQIDGKWRLLDIVSNLSKETVRELVVKLKSTNPSTFSLLTCLGAVHDERSNEFSLIFRMPEDMSDPETLRARLTAGNTSHSLSDRFRLATQLSLAVYSIHAFDMVHKSIRPESIILLQDRKSALGSAFLLGFERLRKDEDGTRLMGDADWEKNLYRHPQRQGSTIRDRYIMQHDIYSLGVCMLEIGLWTSFVEDGGLFTTAIRSQNSMLNLGESGIIHQSEMIKTCLVSLSQGKLAETMGTKYARIVESCLTCLDLGNEDFGEESEVQDNGIAVAIRYIEKVLMQLSDISV